MNEMLEIRNLAWHALQRQLAARFEVAPRSIVALSPALRAGSWLSRMPNGVHANPKGSKNLGLSNIRRHR